MQFAAAGLQGLMAATSMNLAEKLNDMEARAWRCAGRTHIGDLGCEVLKLAKRFSRWQREMVRAAGGR